MDIIVTESLTKRYGRRIGVEALGMHVPEGSLFGFLGPNGAGKTTAIRVLLGFLRPTAGRATVWGMDCWHDSRRIKEEVGYVPGDLRLYPRMSGLDALRLFGAIRRRDLLGEGRRLAERFELDLEVLALVWAHAIAHCTRIPAGEVDRGTIDVLLGLPVSRRQIYFAESLIWLASGAAILLFTLAGNILGRTILANGPELGAGRLAIILANLYCVYLAIGGLSWLVSSACDRRGRAVAVILTFVLASFLLNFVAQFWKAAEQVSFLSVLHYYNPLLIVRDGVWPLRDVLVLLLFGAASWVAGAVVFARRDVATL